MMIRTTPVLPVLLTLLLRGLSVCAAQAPAEFTPPGPNIALHKPYTMDPLPNYGDCADAADATQLTDGEYTKGYFWVQKTTVGWVHSPPVIVTVDLWQVEPIAGLSYSTAAGADRLRLADTVGVWNPFQTHAAILSLRIAAPWSPTFAAVLNLIRIPKRVLE